LWDGWRNVICHIGSTSEIRVEKNEKNQNQSVELPPIKKTSQQPKEKKEGMLIVDTLTDSKAPHSAGARAEVSEPYWQE
jgi:hypothetical protein